MCIAGARKEQWGFPLHISQTDALGRSQSGCKWRKFRCDSWLGAVSISKHRARDLAGSIDVSNAGICVPKFALDYY